MKLNKKLLSFTLPKVLLIPSGFVLVTTILLAYLTSGHMVISDTIGLRLELQIILFVLIGLSIYLNGNEKLETISLILLFTILCFILGELIVRGDFYELIGYILTFSLSYIALTMNKKRLIQTIDLLVNINLIFALLAIFGFIILV